ncbi:MAG: right-handed parallel beta-helix repeat-containing protein [bacterium]
MGKRIVKCWAGAVVAIGVLSVPFFISGCRLVAKEPARIVHKGPGTSFDLQGFIDHALAAGQKRIVVPPGRYRVKPQRQCHLRLRDLQDVEVMAMDVEMVCTETTLALNIDNCRNLALRGLTIDYDPLPFTQGRIVAMAPDKAWLEFEIIDGYPENLEMRIEIFDQRTELLKVNTRYDWGPFQSLGNHRYRVSRGSGHRFDPNKDLEEVGDILVTNSSTAPGGQAGHAIVTSNSQKVVLEDIRLYASNCFSYLEHDCDGNTYRRCSIDRRPLAEDLRSRGLRRLRSSNADAFHSKHAIRGPQIISCTAKYQGDDCVNICGEYYMVMGSSQNKIRMLSHRNSNISVGDSVELVSYTGERLADAKVVAIEADGKVKPEEQTFLKAQHMNQGTKEVLSKPNTDAWTLTLDRAVDLPMGSVVASTRHTGNGFLVKDCDFGFNRSRGILIKGSNGQVIGNRLTGCWMASVLVAPEWWWLESGSSSDLVIADNQITDCRATAIEVVARGGTGALAPSGAHKNIAIRNNTILNSPLPTIYVSSTDRLVISGNQFKPLDPSLSRFRWGEKKPVAIVTEACSQTEVQPEGNNTL